MYAKIFGQIFESSIVENPEVRFTFMDLLVLADQNGVVDMTHEAIARRTNRPLEVIKQTLSVLESPDPKSRTPDDGGRRITRLDDHRDWGWIIINYDTYRSIASAEEKRSKTLVRVQKHREKTRDSEPCNAPVTLCNAPVTLVNACNDKQKHMQKQKQEAVGRVAALPKSAFKAPSLEEAISHAPCVGLSESEARAFHAYHASKGWVVGKVPMKDWNQAMVTWRLNRDKFQQNNTNGPVSIQPSVFNLKTVMEQKQKLADQIRNEHSTTDALSTTWDDQSSREQYRALRGEIKELSQKLAGAL